MLVQKAHKRLRTCEIILFLQRRIVPPMKIHANSRLILARNILCTNARRIPTRSWGYGEFKNVNPVLVQKAHKPLRTCEIIRFHQRRIVPPMEIHANSRLILARNSFCTSKEDTYKKLRVWGGQKCKPCISAKIVQTVIYLRNNPLPATTYSAVNGNSRKFRANPSPEKSLH